MPLSFLLFLRMFPSRPVPACLPCVLCAGCWLVCWQPLFGDVFVPALLVLLVACVNEALMVGLHGHALCLGWG